jgi:hypothetical protein
MPRPALLLVALLAATALAVAACGESDPAPLGSGIALDVAAPARLSETGLYADVAARTLAPGVLPFSPQYPLWSDGAEKRRWIRLPDGTSIDATDFDRWSFPVGTKLWKEFAFGRAVETRLMERLADGRWLLVAYVWDADGRDATLAPEEGVRGIVEVAPGARHDVPSRLDCTACHGGRETPVLGFTALQLSPDRDPLAPNAETPPRGSIDLAGLRASGLLRTRADAPGPASPRIPARSPEERAALGYLHANCASCHREGDLASLGLSFEARPDAPRALSTALGVAARFRFPGEPHVEALRIEPGAPQRSAVVRRMASRAPTTQMPPLGTHVVDAAGLARVEQWIRGLESPAVPPSPPPAPTE